MNIKPNETTKSSPFELFYGRPYSGFLDFRQAKPAVMSPSDILHRWKKLYELVFPAVKKLTKRMLLQSSQNYDKNRLIVHEVLKPGTIVMYEIDGLRSAMKKKTFEPAFNGPCVVERINRAGNYVLRELDTGNLLRARSYAQLKPLLNVKPVTIEGMRKNPYSDSKEFLIKFSDGHSIWVDENSDIVSSLQERDGFQLNRHHQKAGNESTQLAHQQPDSEEIEIVLSDDNHSLANFK